MALGPLDWTGGPFLILYLALFAAAAATSLWIGARLRPEGREARRLDPDELAWLAGGRTRFADAVVARLLAAGDLRLVGRDQLSARPGARGATAAESSILAVPGAKKWGPALMQLSGYAEAVERRLESSGQIISRAEHWRIKLLGALPFALLIAFGTAKWNIGMARDRPVGFLTALLILTLIAALIRMTSGDRRTQAGRAALQAAREREHRLKRAPTTEETGLAVALFGTSVLAGSAFADYHRLRTAAGSTDGGSSSSDSGSSGGCGGGGCGGCGS